MKYFSPSPKTYSEICRVMYCFYANGKAFTNCGFNCYLYCDYKYNCMKKILLAIFIIHVCLKSVYAQPGSENNLVFDSLAARWDEAIPQGNGMLGALVWQKNGRLRLSLDRADLWDERPAIDLSKFNFKWVQQHVANNDYDTVQRIGDDPYEAMPYPTKIPAGALDFDIAALG